MNSEPRQHVTAGLGDHACVGCGYALQGLRHDQNCPECGTPASKSVGLTGVSASDIAIVGCRLLAVWILFRAITDLMEFLPQLLFITRSFRWSREGVFLLAVGTRVAVLVGVGVVLWRWAPAFARRITKSGTGLVVHDGWAADATGIALLVVGVLLVANNLPQFFSNMAVLAPAMYWNNVDNLLLPGVRSVIGLVLLLHPRSLARLVAWARQGPMLRREA